MTNTEEMVVENVVNKAVADGGVKTVEVSKSGDETTKVVLPEGTITIKRKRVKTVATETAEPTVVITQNKLATFRDEDVKTVEACIELNRPVLLVGQTGLGKTTLIKELAAKHNKVLTRLSVHSGVSGDEILGKWLAKNGSTVWQNGLLIQAMEKGEWIVFDEINACSADVLFSLHSLLDDDRKITLIEKDGEVIRPHADFRFFATMNPVEDYAGTKEMNMAFASRFGATIEIKAYSLDQEVKILENNGCKNNAVNKRLVMIANSLRDLKSMEKITYYCGTRDLINVAMLEPKIGIDLALLTGLLNKVMPEDKEEVLKFLGNVKFPLTSEQKKIEELSNVLKTKDNHIKAVESSANNLRQQYQKLESEKRTAEASANAMKQVVQKLEQDVKTLSKGGGLGGGNVNLDPKVVEALRILGVTK